ncbi:hypothetical protein ACFQMM_03575 [Saliphagus sp. GCM10025308]
MTALTRDPNQPDDERRDITPTQLFTAFSHDRRQHAVAYLAQKPAAIPLGDLAEYIAIKEGEPTNERYERVLTDLAHCHLPHLRDAGLVRYSTDEEQVELAVGRTVVAPYLELCGHANA